MRPWSAAAAGASRPAAPPRSPISSPASPSMPASPRASMTPPARSMPAGACRTARTPARSATRSWRRRPGELTFEVNRRLLKGGLVVSDAEVEEAMRQAFRHLKIVVEPGGAVALAAALSGRSRLPRPHRRRRALGRQCRPGALCPHSFEQLTGSRRLRQAVLRRDCSQSSITWACASGGNTG